MCAYVCLHVVLFKEQNGDVVVVVGDDDGDVIEMLGE